MTWKYERLLEAHKKSGERVIDFSRDIFGDNSKLGLAYFNRKSISTYHLEKICEHYHLPMSYFFDSPSFEGKSISQNNVGVGNTNINTGSPELRNEVTILRQEIANREDTIKWLKNQCDNYMLTLQALMQHAPKIEKEK